MEDYLKPEDGSQSPGASGETKSVRPGSQSFLELITKKAGYVDKTGMILELLNESSGPYFLSRPRRFGKTVLLDTIRAIGSGDRCLFEGLEIAKDEHKYQWDPFPVIRIAMNTVDPDPERFETSMISRLVRIGKLHKAEIDASGVMAAISGLIETVSMNDASFYPKDSESIYRSGHNVALLIDEYDFPLLCNINDQKKANEIRIQLHHFYSAIKGSSDFLRFIFVTGITKFSQASFFSSMNNVDDLTLDPRFSAICGFTLEEIEKFYGPKLESATPKFISTEQLQPNSTPKELLDKLLHWYDSYSWDGQTRVLNPYSVKRCLDTFKFDYYWYNSGTSLFTMLMERKHGNLFKVFGNDLSIDEHIEIMDTENISDASFLLQTGYLTVDSVDVIGEGHNKSLKYNLRIPNLEVRYAINHELALRFLVPQGTDDPTKYLAIKKNDLLSAFCSRNVDETERLLWSIFSSIPNILYHGGADNILHIMLISLLKYGDAWPCSEVFSDGGRSDLIFQIPDGGFIVIEVKHEKGSSQPKGHDSSISPYAHVGASSLLKDGLLSETEAKVLDRKVKEAFNQIMERHYTRPLMKFNQKICAAAVAVYGTSKVMVRFADVVWRNEIREELGWNEMPYAISQGPLSQP
ncbi:MAG: AAA family ATPase [Deltaproteobacteria bacterium]|nr:AAA family ATPase [Deltaproteobacteria bacterium]